MSFSMPLDIVCHIADFIPHPSILTKEELKKFANQIRSIALLDVSCSESCREKLVQLKKINALLDRYNFFNVNERFKYRVKNGNPYLLEALCRGALGLWVGTITDFTPEIEADIIDMMTLTPQSMACKVTRVVYKEVYCYDYYGYGNPSYSEVKHTYLPLVNACINVLMPLHIIERMLINGADQNANFFNAGQKISVYDYVREEEARANDLNLSERKDRFKKIAELFQKYSNSPKRGLSLPVLSLVSCKASYTSSNRAAILFSRAKRVKTLSVKLANTTI